MAPDAEASPDDVPPALAAGGLKVTPIPPPAVPLVAAAAETAASPPPRTASPSPGVSAGPATLALPTAAADGLSGASPRAATPKASPRASPGPPGGPPPNPPSSLPQKRALADEDHTPAVRSPLNPDALRATPRPGGGGADDVPNVAAREKRAKKDSLKKRESKAAAAAAAAAASGLADARATPEPRRKEGADGPAGGTDAAPGNGGRRDAPKTDEGLPVRVRLAGALRPSDFDPPASPIFRSRQTVPVVGGEEVEFLELLEQPINRRGYVYESAVADPRFPATHYFRQTDTKPHAAHLSFEDAPPNVFLDQAGCHITGEGGFRTARANVAARQGRWYWECRVTRGIQRGEAGAGATTAGESGGGGGDPPSRGHVRMGWARREASRDAPVGYDAYGYGLRDRQGQKVHMSRPRAFLGAGVDICEGDVVGLEIQLPPEALHRKVVRGAYNPAVDLLPEDGGGGHGDDDGCAPNVVRDRIPFRFQTTKPVFEKFDYVPVRELEDLANPAPTLAKGGGGGGSGGGGGGSGGNDVHGGAHARKDDGGTGGGNLVAGEPPNPHHPVPSLRTLPGSCVRVYKNGRLQGTPFANLLAFLPPASSANSKLQEGARERLDDGTLGYYPAVSVFRGGAAEVNFGPRFWCPPPGAGLDGVDGVDGADDDDVAMVDAGDAGDAAVDAAPPPPLAPLALTRLRPMSERYAEQIAEDVVYDLVDEVYFWLLDGGGDGAAAASSHGSTLTAAAAADDKDVAMEE